MPGWVERESKMGTGWEKDDKDALNEDVKLVFALL
jgi:hypothetical protein